MKRTKIYKQSRKAVLGFLRNKPRVRSLVRKAYWKLRKFQFELLSFSKTIQPKTVLFESYGGRSVSCSPKALFLEMISCEEYTDWQIIWSLRESAYEASEMLNSLSDPRIKTVIRGSREYFDSLATASAIVMNTRLPEYVYPKPEQVYVQCWHGTPLKKLGCDAIGKTDSALNTATELARRFRIDSKKWSYLLSPSSFTSEALFSAFGVPIADRQSLLIEEGYPRNDVLVHSINDDVRQSYYRQKHGVPRNKKVILYAPTWRDDRYVSGLGYIADAMMDMEELRASLSDDWIVLFRAHYYIAESFDFSNYEGFVVDVSKVEDINELYIASDIMITDYSSTIFDFAILRRPICLFVSDREHYEHDLHGFYMQLEDIPAPICTTTKEVISFFENIYRWEEEYGVRFDDFMKEYCPHEDGATAKRVMDKIFR